MSEISDLKQRVEAVGQKFGRLAEQESSYGERLSGLLSAVEEGFARSQSDAETLRNELANAQTEIEKLTGELDAAKEDARAEVKKLTDELGAAKEESRAEVTRLTVELDTAKDDAQAEIKKLAGELEAAKEKTQAEITQLTEERDAAKEEARQRGSEVDGARDESKQLRGMLLALLEAVESGGDLDLGETMRNLESRIDQIVSSTDGKPDETSTEGSADAVAVSPEPAEAEPAVTEPAVTEPAEAEPAEAEPVPTELEVTEEATLVLSPHKEEAPEAEPSAPMELVSDQDEVSSEEILASVEEVESPAESEAAAAEDEETEPPSDDDLSAVNKIIQRISLLTGEFVEPSQKHEKDVGVPSLKLGNGADDAGSRKSKDESAAKST